MYFLLEGKFTAPTQTSFAAYPTPEEAAYFAAKKRDHFAVVRNM
jgi:hypothetical protein